MHPLLTSVHCPFNLLRSFKEGAHRSKTYFIIVSPFPCRKNTLCTVCVYVRSAHSVLRVCKMRKRSAYACHTNLWMIATISWWVFAFVSYTETCCLRGSQTRAQQGFRWSQTRIRNPFPSLALCCKMLVTDPVTVYCGQRYYLKAKLPGGGKFWKKTQKVMLKIRFGKGKNGP